MENTESTTLLRPRSDSVKKPHQNALIRSGNFQHLISTSYYFEAERSTERSETYTNGQDCDNNKGTTKDEENDQGKLKFSTLPTRKKCLIAMCAISNVLEGCGFSLLAPFFPQMAETKGMSITLTGFAFSMFELIIFVTSPLFGSYLTTLGPKFVLLSGTFVGGMCTILFGTLDKCPPGTPFIVISLMCRAIGAIGFSALINSIMALLCNEFPKSAAMCYAILQTAFGIGMMVGPAIGGALYEIGGFGLPFYVIGALVLLKGTLVYFLMNTVENISVKQTGSRLSLLRSAMVVIPMFSITSGSLGMAFIDPTLSAHLEPFGLSVGVIGLLFVIIPSVYTAFSPLLGYVTDTKSYYPILICMGHLVFGVGFFILGPSDLLPFLPYDLWTICIGLALIGASLGCLILPTMKCMIIGASEVGFEENLDTYAVVAGLMNSMYSLGAFTGPMFGGILVQELGFFSASSIIGALNIIMCVLTSLFFTTRYYRRRKTYKLLAKVGQTVEL